MGIDIHIYREIKLDDKWQFAGKLESVVRNDKLIYEPQTFWQQRDYTLFQLLSGVAYSNPKPNEVFQLTPLGLPDDLSDQLKAINIHEEDCSCYHLSYATYKDIDDFLKRRTSEKYFRLREFRHYLDTSGDSYDGIDFYWGNEKYHTFEDIPSDRKRIIYFYDC